MSNNSESIKIKSDRVLIVEGKDEINFFNALFKELDLPVIQILDLGGKDKFQQSINLLKFTEGYSSITHMGFVRDADSNRAQSAFDSISSILSRNSLPVPASITEIADSYIKTGIYIMPNNDSEGMLEDLCFSSLSDQAVVEAINSYLSSIETINPQEYNKLNISKSKVMTYIACKKPQTNSLGLAALMKHFDMDSQCFNLLKKFLTDLFS